MNYFIFQILFILLYFVKTLLNSENDNKDIIYDTLQNNPKNSKNILPSFPKIVTRSGELCDFPFIYKKRKYVDECCERTDGKFYCKVHFKDNHEKSQSNAFTNDLFPQDLLHLVKIGNNFYSECLSVDQTENFLDNLVEENYDFKKKLLIDLYSDIKKEILKLNLEKLNLLFELSENYCKSSNFNFDCLYSNLIMPISKTKDLRNLSNKIFKIFEIYKARLRTLLDRSNSYRFKQIEYEFINKNNLNFYNNTNYLSVTNTSQSLSNLEQEIDVLINKEKNENPNSNIFSSTITLSKFFEILVSIYDECNQECKSTLDYLFIDNFSNNMEKIKLEVMLRLFEYPKVNETEFLHKLYPNKKKDSIIYKTKIYPLNPQLERFLNYKSWSVRYLITIIHRYILLDKLFYVDIIKGEMTEEQFKEIISPEIQIDRYKQVKLMRVIPLLTPYLDFSKEIINKIEKIYNKSRSMTKDIDIFLRSANNTLDTITRATHYVMNKINKRVRFFDGPFNKTLNGITIKQSNIKKADDILSQSENRDSILNSVKLEAQESILDYINKIIYKSTFISQECHKFLHYHTYFNNFTTGRPTLNYVSLGYDPYFFIDFENDIKLFFLYAVLNTDSKVKKQSIFNITIITQATIDFYLEHELIAPISTNPAPDTVLNKNLIMTIYSIKSTALTAYRQIKIKGRFPFQESRLKKHFLFNITSSIDNLTEAESKSKQSLHDASMCFDQSSYKIGCDVACNILTQRLKMKLNSEKSSKDYHNLLYGDNTNSNQSKKSKKKLSLEEKDRKKDDKTFNPFKQELIDFSINCENYCSKFQWSLPIFKCLYRKMESHKFDSLLIKCGTLSSWQLVVRNSKSLYTKHYNDYSINDVLLGKKFFFDDSVTDLKLKYIPYMIPSIINPLSNVTFITQFNYNEIKEYMFTSGDISKFVVLDKYQPFIKGAPFTAFSSHNNNDVFYLSIYNLFYQTELMNSKGLIIYDTQLNSTKSNFLTGVEGLIFSDNELFNNHFSNLNSKRQKLTDKGVNIYVRKNSALCNLNQRLFSSNLASEQFYIENVLLTKNIFSYTDNDFLILRIPEILDGHSILVKTTPYQTEYSLSINYKSRLYLAVEVTKHFEKSAEYLSKNEWKFLNGTSNIIEIVTVDIGDDMLEKGKYSFYDCEFNQANPVCKDNILDRIDRIQMSIFYKDFDIGDSSVKYSFFDFDDLYASLHLLIIQPLDCQLENNNIHTYKDNINNFMISVEDYLPTFDSDIDEFIRKVTKSDISVIKIPNEEINETKILIVNQNNTHNESNIKLGKNSEFSMELHNKLHSKNLKNSTCIDLKHLKFEEFINFIEYDIQDDKFKYNDMLKTVSHVNEDGIKYYYSNNITGEISITSPNEKLVEFAPGMKIKVKIDNNQNTKRPKYQYKTQILGKRVYTKPSVKFNQNGCTLALDRYGNLFYKNLIEIKNGNM